MKKLLSGECLRQFFHNNLNIKYTHIRFNSIIVHYIVEGQVRVRSYLFSRAKRQHLYNIGERSKVSKGGRFKMEGGKVLFRTFLKKR